MASNDNAIYFSRSPNSQYENWKHIVDIPDDQKASKDWNIYDVPSNLRKLNEEAYTPQLVSIGPIHHGLKKLNPMQDQKLRYLKSFWGRHVENKIKAMDRFKRYLEDEEEKIRGRYAGNLCDDDKIKKEELVEMMFLDSVFIMELYLRIQKQKLEDSVEQQTDSDDIILKQPWRNNCIQRDLLLLENQIPLFILEELYNNFVPNNDKKRPSFIELAHDYFDRFHPYEKCNNKNSAGSCLGKISSTCNNNNSADSCMGKISSSYSNNREPSTCNNNNSAGPCLGKISSSRFILLKKNWPGNNYDPQHFTDLIRSFYICKDLSCSKEKVSSLETATKGSSFRTATKLREAGVSFEVVNNKPLLDINFNRIRILSWFLCFGCIPNFTYFKARLQIPKLKVDCTTECVLRNLIAFEQCHYPNEPYICNYVSFVDSLIHTKDDVELLVEKEVIVHELGSDKEVATLVNGLCKHVVTNKTCYVNLIDKLNRHYLRRWNRTMAALRLVYFRDAWRASSTLVATAVLVFTIFNFFRVVRLVLDLEGGYKRP